MPEMVSIEVRPRQLTGKKVEQLRRSGVVPGVVYGHGVDVQAIEVEARVLDRFLAGISASSLIGVQVAGEGAPRASIIREVQRDSLTQRVRHIDFLQVNLTERLRADVPIVLVGESPAVTDGGGVLAQGLTAVEVECLPMDLPAEIEVDISELRAIDDEITVADLKVPEGVEVHSPADQTVVRVIAERAAEEEEPLEVTETQEVEVITEKRTQERRRAEEEG